MFNVLCCLRKDKSVLVTSGLHPVGQAAIAISLAEKCATYAVVESGQQADRLSDIFPEVIIKNLRRYNLILIRHESLNS